MIFSKKNSSAGNVRYNQLVCVICADEFKRTEG